MPRFQLRNLRWALLGAVAAALAVATAGGAANGGNLVLGQINTATAKTQLTATTSSPALQLVNNGTGVPLSLTAPSNVTPLMVNSSVKVTNLNADKLDGLDSTAFWSLTGNAGTAGTNFIGTTDNKPLNFRVNNLRALRIETGGGSGPNVIGGASQNLVTAGKSAATIAGGGTTVTPNKVTGDYGAVGGGQRNTAGFEANVAGGDQNTASAENSAVGGGTLNNASTAGATIAGGSSNAASGSFAAIAGGSSNTATNTWASVAGGTTNHATGSVAAIGGGSDNTASNNYATVAGGWSGTASGPYASVGGGRQNSAGADFATVAGGDHNTASGFDAIVAGGQYNTASGAYSFAAGTQAKADDNGAFVWTDSQPTDVSSPGEATFTVRASGGMWLGTTSSPAITAGHFIDTSTNAYLTSTGIWTDASDRALKHDFRPLDKRSVLDRVARMPITSWSYKTEKPGIRHIGPVAQDFYKAFGLGLDDKHITTIDEGGVALAAIQGLYKQNLALQKRVSRLEQQLRALSHRSR